MSIDCLRSSKLKPRRGAIYVAQGKRVRERRPGCAAQTPLPLTAKSRDSANLICGIFGKGGRAKAKGHLP
jgi:hypothetical protein